MKVEFAGQPSWRITEDEGWDLTVALFVRDITGIRDQRDADGPPPLLPDVAADDEIRQSIDITGARAAWNSWWSAVVRERTSASPGDDPRVRLRRSAPQTLLAGRLEGLLESAFAWADQYKIHEIERFQRLGHADRTVVNRIVDAVTEPLGRPPRPFLLTLTTLPVAGIWSNRPDRIHMLLSTGVRTDATTFEGVLRPVLDGLV